MRKQFFYIGILTVIYGIAGCGVMKGTTDEHVLIPNGSNADVATIESAERADTGRKTIKKADNVTSMSEKTIDTTVVWLDFESGFVKAIKENKMLLVDAYTDWCGWCKVMERETYTDKEVIKIVNTNFVTVKLNPEKNREYKFADTSMSASELYLWLGHGQSNGFPSTFFMISPASSPERYTAVGHMEPKDFIAVLNQVLAKRK